MAAKTSLELWKSLADMANKVNYSWYFMFSLNSMYKLYRKSFKKIA